MLKELSKSDKAKTHFKLGELELDSGNSVKSFKHLNKARQIYKSLNRADLVSKSNQKLSDLYFNIQRWDKSIEYGKLALNGIKNNRNSDRIHVLEQLATSHIRLDLEKSALKYAKMRLECCSDSDLECKADGYMIFAFVHGGANNLDSSIYYNELALKMLKDSSFILRSAIINNLGVTYKEMGEYEKAIDVLKIAKSLYEKNNEDYFVAVTWLNIGLVERLQKNYDSSFVHTKKALDVILDGRNHIFLKDCYLNLAEIADIQGRSKCS